MGPEKNESTNVTDQLKEYLNTRLKRISYQAAIKGTAVAADVIAEVVILFCYLLTFLFASVTLGFFLTSFLGSGRAGFGCVALIYLVIGIAVVIFKKQFERPIASSFIKKIIK